MNCTCDGDYISVLFSDFGTKADGFNCFDASDYYSGGTTKINCLKSLHSPAQALKFVRV